MLRNVMHSPSLDDLRRVASWAEFWDVVGTVEHERLDFKRGVPDDIQATMPAMAMTTGGLIVHGIDDRRQVVGCPLSPNTQDRITRYAHNCHLEVEVAEIDVEGTKLTVVEIPEVVDRIITTPDGRLLRRRGGDCQPLIGDAMARFVRARTDASAEESSEPRISPAAVDLAAVNRALKADGRPAVRSANVLRALLDLGGAVMTPTGPVAINAGAVLFAKRPSDFIPGASVQLVRRSGVGPGPGPTLERIELSAPIDVLVVQTLEFLARHTKRHEIITGSRRETFSEYPETVLREAVLNALAHRDYGLRSATVDVTVWDDRIEIRSPGSLPGHITLDNMRDEHYSRNRRIMRVLKLVGFVEEYGEGVDRMIGDMEARLMEPPVFTDAASSVTVTLRNRISVSVEDQAWLTLLASYDLTPAERRVLVSTRNSGSVTRREVRSALPDVDAESLLAGMVARGLLQRQGERGGTHYVLSHEVVVRSGAQGLDAQQRKLQLLTTEMRRRGSLSTTEGASLLGEDLPSVRELLNNLVRSGAARLEGQTRARRYYPR